MSDSLDRRINYIFSITDNTSEVSSKSSANSKKASTNAKIAKASEAELTASIDSTTAGVTTQTASIVSSTNGAKTSLDGLSSKSNVVADKTNALASKVSESHAHMVSSATDAEAIVDRATIKQQALNSTIQQTTARVSQQQLKLAMQVTAITGMQGAVAGLVGGITALGVCSEETEKKLVMVAGAFQILAGVANGIKALQLVMDGLNLSTLTNALLNTYNAVIRNPAALALVGVAGGAAIGAAAYMSATNNNSTSTTTANIVVNGETSEGSKTTASNVYSIIGGI